MSARTPFVAGNWKMHKTASETPAFVADVAARLPDGVDTAVVSRRTAVCAGALSTRWNSVVRNVCGP